MVFGIGTGLFFGYLPFIKLHDLPLITFRSFPGTIFKLVTKRLGIKVTRTKFKNPKQAMDELDRLLEQGIPVGAQTGAFWLPYFPPALRFHFNMHNLVVYGKQNNTYLVSDPVVDRPVEISYEDLMRARFAKGPLAPHGKLYYIEHVGKKPDLAKPIVKGIKDACNRMLRIPIPLFGVKGIRNLAHQVRKWPSKLGSKKAELYVGQLIRMQEEIGTGGAGFRFIFSSFLQESARELDQDWLNEMSRQMTETGDRWRELAVLGARICKGRVEQDQPYEILSNILLDCAQREESVYKKLRTIKLR